MVASFTRSASERSSSDRRATADRLLRLQKEAELYHMALAPGFILASAPHATSTRELLAVQHGAIRVRSGTDEQVLQTGDSAYYLADVEHSIENVGADEAN